MADRYMRSDQADIHDAVHKLEKFRSHSGHSDHWVTDGKDVTKRRKSCKHRKNI